MHKYEHLIWTFSAENKYILTSTDRFVDL